MNDQRSAQASAALDSAAADVADSAGCSDLLPAVTRTRGWVDAVEASVTGRMRDLHASAGAKPAADRLTRCGVSSAEGQRTERRSEIIDAVPSFGDALGNGEIGADHVDASANATARLDDGTTARLLGGEADLLSPGGSTSPTTAPSPSPTVTAGRCSWPNPVFPPAGSARTEHDDERRRVARRRRPRS